MEKLQWLGKKEELEFSKIKFSGKNAGKRYQYSNCIDGLIRARVIIFAMGLLIFYPVFMTYIRSYDFDFMFFVERLIMATMLFTAGLLFNKFRIFAIILAALPIAALLLSKFVLPGHFSVLSVAFPFAILSFILSGLYYHFKAQKLKKALLTTLPENQLL